MCIARTRPDGAPFLVHFSPPIDAADREQVAAFGFFGGDGDLVLAVGVGDNRRNRGRWPRAVP
jgi:hypothetical protein